MKPNGSESADVDAAPPMQGAPAISTSPAAPAPSAPAVRRWIDIKAAAEYAGVGVKILREAVRAGHLRGSAVGSRGQLRFWQDVHTGAGGWVDDWLQSLSGPIDDAPSHGRVRSR